MGRPKTMRSRAYCTALSSAALPMPTASAAMTMRSGFRPVMMWAKPSPSSPTRSLVDTRRSSMNSSLESTAWRPIFSISRTETAARSISAKKRDMPLDLLAT